LPIALHFLRSRPKKEVRFPTLRFLQESVMRDMRRHRLRRWLTLALRTLVIALLVAAFARPFWKNQQAAQQTAIVVAVDNSMSMQAGSRWEDLRRQALAEIDLLAPGDQAALLQINPSPRWIVPLTQNVAGVRAALMEMKPGFEATHYPAALRMAGDALAAIPAHSKIIAWMADEQRLGWLGTPFDQPLPPGIKVRFGQSFSEPRRQAAITSTRWVAGAETSSIEVAIRLFKPASDHRRLTIRAGDTVLAEQPVSLQQSTENKVSVPLKMPPGQTVDGLKVSLDPDDLPADDTAWLAIAPQVGTAVLCEAPKTGADFLAHALGSTHRLNESPLDAVPFPGGDWRPSSVAIVRDGAAFAPPRVEHLDRFAKAGGALWIFIDGSEAQRRWLDARGVHVAERPAESEPWHLRDWDSDSPVLSAFSGEGLLSLMDVEFYQGFELSGDAVVPLANWPNGSAAIALVNSGGQKFLLCGFLPERAFTDWLVQPSFVPLVHQAVRWLASLNTTSRDWRVGDTVALPAEKGWWRSLDSPRAAPPREVSGSVRPDAPGLY
ncbi:MAG: VWA domain-containing protein, partial [Gemmatimonadetes bacterium]|nr:VWA domain-containing protein [Gemmatimonadota bacterium]